MNILKAIYRHLARKPEPVAIVEAEQPTQSAPVMRIDSRIPSIKAVAAQRIGYRAVPDDMYAGLSDRTKTWLQTLSPEMLLLVNGAPYSRLHAHLYGRKTIRGLLAADVDSIAAFTEAMQPKVVFFDGDAGRRSGGGPKHSMGGMKL